MTFLNKTSVSSIKASQLEIASSGLILQTFCNSTLQQPIIDFKGSENLTDLQDDINLALENAKRHANVYLIDINHRIIGSLSDLKGYFTLYSTVPTTLPEGATVEEWLAVLNVIKNISEANLRKSEAVVAELEDLRTILLDDSNKFAELSQRATDAIEGDQGELEALSNELKAIDREIKAQIAAVVGESLAIVGGTVAMVVGIAAESLSFGATTALVVGGVLTVAGSTALLASSSAALANLYDAKSSLFQDKAKLTAEIQLLTGVDAALNNISEQADTAAFSTREMVTIWQGLGSDIQELIEALESGIQSTDEVREFFLESANNEIAEIQETLNQIKQQLTGVVTIVLPEDESIPQYLANLEVV